ncbi:hypothetical protein MMC19_006141, partial [Ptychographa xylographoides]|nr:hypothetical protein [Ptychographa xylographoides]
MASLPVIKPKIPGGVPSRLSVEPNIPMRLSSKRRVDEASQDKLVAKRDNLSKDTKQLGKKLKPGLSYNAP